MWRCERARSPSPETRLCTSPSARSQSRSSPAHDLIREHLEHRGKSLYASRETGWLFPGGNPDRHLATENIRSQLVAIGIKPYENRKATLFQLAGEIPAPVLAELIGITNNNAADWARLAARDWTDYIAERAR